MPKSRRLRFALAVVLVAVPAAFAASAARPATPPAAGIWQRLPAAPITPGSSVSVWSGREMLIFGRAQPNPPWSVNVAAAYNPATDTWRKLAPPPGPTGNYEGHFSAVWTGTEMLVLGPLTREAYNPATNRWRRLPNIALPGGIVIWTGREMIGWGGGCCGDASSEGAAYNPATNKRRALASSPLAPEQLPIGAWTGRELVLFVGGINPANGKPWPTRLARAAAYNPLTNRWRRIAPLPARRAGATAVWSGHEILVVGGTDARGAPATVGFAYNLTTNHWRRLAPMESGRTAAAMVWTGRRLLVWGGESGRPSASPIVIPPHGLAYDPRANRWSPLPQAPLKGRLDPTAVWTGHAMIVFGGHRPAIPVGTGEAAVADGAAFRPATT